MRWGSRRIPAGSREDIRDGDDWLASSCSRPALPLPSRHADFRHGERLLPLIGDRGFDQIAAIDDADLGPLDPGNLAQQQEAEALLRRAGTGSTTESRDLMQQAAQVDPENAQAHNRLARLLATGRQELKNAEQSLPHARRAVELEHGNRAYINTLGVALYRNARYDEAIPMLERSLELNRQQSGAYDLLFLALCYQGGK